VAVVVDVEEDVCEMSLNLHGNILDRIGVLQANDSERWVWYNILERRRGRSVRNNASNRRRTGSGVYSSWHVTEYDLGVDFFRRLSWFIFLVMCHSHCASSPLPHIPIIMSQTVDGPQGPAILWGAIRCSLHD
jgi:hypothetical protein